MHSVLSAIAEQDAANGLQRHVLLFEKLPAWAEGVVWLHVQVGNEAFLDLDVVSDLWRSRIYRPGNGKGTLMETPNREPQEYNRNTLTRVLIFY